MIAGIAISLILCCLLIPCQAADFSNEDELNLHCLREAYPEIGGLERDAHGNSHLRLTDGRLILYDDGQGNGVKISLDQPYPLEPDRPDTPTGLAPGRERPYDLFKALYGKDKTEVSSQLAQVSLNGGKVAVSGRVAEHLALVAADLDQLARANPALRRYLKPDGGFMWRKIAGEDRLSAHSFGIAVDIGSRHAPYWRWSRVIPHPAQKTYPAEIVEAFEKRGFIWGGKWHEYDLMHFEYRPELICKARIKKKPVQGQDQPASPDQKPAPLLW